MKRVQIIRYSTAAMASQTGLAGEIFIDFTKNTLVANDGILPGGYPLAREDLSNVAVATSSAAGKLSAADKIKLNAYPSPSVALAFLQSNAGATAFSQFTVSQTLTALGISITFVSNGPGQLFLSDDGTYKRNIVNIGAFGR